MVLLHLGSDEEPAAALVLTLFPNTKKPKPCTLPWFCMDFVRVQLYGFCKGSDSIQTQGLWICHFINDVK